MNNLDQFIYNNYNLSYINSVIKTRYLTLSIYYRPLTLLLKHDPPIRQPHTVQDYIDNLGFFIQ